MQGGCKKGVCVLHSIREAVLVDCVLGKTIIHSEKAPFSRNVNLVFSVDLCLSWCLSCVALTAAVVEMMS